MDSQLEMPLLNANGNESEEECSENNIEIKEEKPCDYVLNYPGESLKKQTFYLQVGNRRFTSDSDNINKDEKIANSNQGPSTLVQSISSDLFDLPSPEEESKSIITSSNYNEIGTVTHMKEENVLNNDDLTPIPFYLTNDNLSEHVKYQSSENTEIKPDEVCCKLLETTTDFLCENGSKIQNVNNEAEELSECDNEIPKRSQQPAICGKVREESRIKRKGKSCNNCFEINPAKNNQKMETEATANLSTIIIEHENLFSLKRETTNECEVKIYELQLREIKVPSHSNLRSGAIDHAMDHRFECDYLKAQQTTRIRDKSFQCELCAFKCIYASALKIHMRTHTGEKPFQCELCGHKCAKRGHLKEHIRTHLGVRSFKCDLCGYKFTAKGALRKHMRTHTGERPFKCELCGYTFTVTGNLTMHMRTHTSEKPFKCDLCGYKSSAKFNLEKHIRLHFGLKPFECGSCSYKCNTSSDLKMHMRRHSLEKPCQCDVCGYKYSCASSLKTHMKVHSGEKPFECQLCGFKFARKGDFRSHIGTHTGEIIKPFQCDVCGFKFAQSSHLKVHMRTHTGEKPFQCELCDAKFAVKGSLKKHTRTHTGEKPYECKLCGYKFNLASHLKRHMRTHEGKRQAI